MAGEPYVLNGSYKWIAERNEYVGVISKIGKDVLEVVAIGCELTEQDILVWIRETVKVMRATGTTDVQAADMYDRAGMKPLQ